MLVRGNRHGFPGFGNRDSQITNGAVRVSVSRNRNGGMARRARLGKDFSHL